jgi:hypothetical protein
MGHLQFPLLRLKGWPMIRRCAGGYRKSRRIAVALHKRDIYGRFQLSQFVGGRLQAPVERFKESFRDRAAERSKIVVDSWRAKRFGSCCLGNRLAPKSSSSLRKTISFSRHFNVTGAVIQIERSTTIRPIVVDAFAL